MERLAWVCEIRRINEQQEDELAPVYDERWGAIEPQHRAEVAAFLARLPPGGRVLDAPCGTGKYLALVAASGRTVVGVDHAAAYLAVARGKVPGVALHHCALQELALARDFDGVMCVDALEMIPPEDWPVVLARFARALRGGGALYLTVELPDEARLAAVNAEARRTGLPVIDREWAEPDGYYHYYPPLAWVSDQLAGAGFAIDREREGERHPEGHAYHHVHARLRSTT